MSVYTVQAQWNRANAPVWEPGNDRSAYVPRRVEQQAVVPAYRAGLSRRWCRCVAAAVFW